MVLWLLCVLLVVGSTTRTEGLPQGRKIDTSQVSLADLSEHETCLVNGEEGRCMYQWECHRTGGSPLGICKHGFQFGCCCKHDVGHNQVTDTPTIEEATPTAGKITPTTPTDVILIVDTATSPKPPASDVIDTLITHECGMVSKSSGPSSRIVNGTQTYAGEVPWQVSIMRYAGIKDGFTHHCGGALVNRKWVVTAAHCVTRNLLVELKVRVGEHDLTFRDATHPFRDHKIKRKVVHPDYLTNTDYFHLTFENDIALLELKEGVRFKRHITPICLPKTEDALVGRMGLVTGWGKRKDSGNLTNILQKVSLPVLSNKECESMYKKAGLVQHIPDIFLCAGYENGGSDACSGDSGGPLQTKSADGRFVLSGVVSWGHGCGVANKPGVYTRISKYVPWILDHVTPDAN